MINANMLKANCIIEYFLDLVYILKTLDYKIIKSKY